jgi:hypothetical protein
VRRRRLVGATGLLVGLGATAVALQWAGQGALAAPPLTEPGRWAEWLGGRDPVLAAFSLLRVVALGSLWYLAGVTLLGAVVRLAGAGKLLRLTDRVTVAPVRRMLAGGVSLGLAASGVVTVGAPALRAPVAAAQTSTTSTSTTMFPPATVTMHRLGPAEPPRPAAVPVPDIAGVAPPATDRWKVKPGECFWSIAEEVLTARWGRPPTDAEVVTYWQRLIEANRHELAHRDNADLIFPAQVFVIPSP